MTQPFGEIVSFASRNRGEGKLIEPRFYYDTIDFTTVSPDPGPYGATVGTSDLASMTNGEQFPVRLTHLLLSPMMTPPSSGTDNKILYQRASGVQFPTLRVERYGEYYMNETFIRASAWHNAKTAQPLNLASGSVTHRFFQPLVLSARDSLRIEFESIFPGVTPMTIPAPNAADVSINASLPGETNLPPMISVQLSGVGMRSGRTYEYGGSARSTQNIAAPSIFVCDPADFTNVGQEPVALTQITVTAGVGIVGQVDTQVPMLNDVRFFRMQLRQTGNGTQANFFRGPTYPTLQQRMPLALLGTHLGDAVVHELAGDGIQLDPGEVVRVSAQNIAYTDNLDDNTNAYPTLFAVGFAGYLMVT